MDLAKANFLGPEFVQSVSYACIGLLVILGLAAILYDPLKDRLVEGYRQQGSILLVSFTFVVILLLIPLLGSVDSDKCYIKCSGDSMRGFFNSRRGLNYRLKNSRNDIDTVLREMDGCAVTAFSISHFIAYALLGFLAPNYLPVILLVSGVWEYAETFIECSDWMDIVQNISGALFGATLRSLLEARIE